MGLFSKRERLRTALRRLEDRVEDCERSCKTLDGDLDDMHDKLKRFTGRRARRETRDAAAPDNGKPLTSAEIDSFIQKNGRFPEDAP